MTMKCAADSAPIDPKQEHPPAGNAGAVRRCPALFVGAPASGQGKTTVTAALARHHCRQGRQVRVFKTGPDFLDPMILERACGHPVDVLDLWMVGEEEIRRLLYTATEADLILVEGVMGLFDGEPSGADLAIRLGLPALAVIDASAMAQTFGALCHGLAHYQPQLWLAGVLANRVAGPGHSALLAKSVPRDIRYFGYLPRQPALALPDRHLGLVQASEVADLEQRLDAAAAAIAATGAAELPPPVAFLDGAERTDGPLLEGVRIGVARDFAFSFIYPANLRLLEKLGARIEFFSPIADRELPQVDSLWLPGGYPELHLKALAQNAAMKVAIRAHHAAGKPILAECGGMLYLLDALTEAGGERAELVGLIEGEAAMQNELAAIGSQSLDLPEGELRGHTFHHSRLATRLAPWRTARSPHGTHGEALYRVGRLTASYVHFYFPSNPGAAASLFLR